MRISFDLDDTLMVCGRPLPTIAPSGLGRFVCAEHLRVGAPELLRELSARGHEVGVYTSSDRARLRIWLDFLAYGVGLGHIVNKTVHDRWWRGLPPARRADLSPCVKYPPAFGIDLLVDDSVSVTRRGRELGYRVALVDPADPAWCETVRRAVERSSG